MSRQLAQVVGFGTIGVSSFFWGRSSAPTAITEATPVKVVPAGESNVPTRKFDPSVIRPQDFYKFGFPGPVHDLENRQEFVSCYDRKTRNPYWVVEHITQDSIKSVEGVDRKKSIFREDETIPSKFRNKLRDFFRSGYDRGHNAPAADAKFSQDALNETFYLTNMSPQVGEGFNRDYWAHLEDFGRRLTKKYDNVRIMTGPLYLPKKCDDDKYRVTYEVIGSPPNIAVPTHFFKLIVGENNNSEHISVAAFVLPNDRISNDTPLTSFQVPVDALERSSGLELLHRVPYSNKKDLCRETNCDIIVREFPKQISGLIAK